MTHHSIDKKLSIFASQGHITPHKSMLKTPTQIEAIKKSAALNTAILDYVSQHICAGISTADIDKLVYDYTKTHGGIPAPLGYEGFPKSVCTSINDQVCHGIPSEDIILQEGDIVNVDVSTLYNGFYSDSSRMFIIGQTTPEKEKLVRVAKECIEKGLEQVKPWQFLGDMSEAINRHAQENGFSIVVDIGGHGIGLEFHEEPYVCYVAPAGTEMLMVPGFVFTIEPMVNAGTEDIYIDDNDGWGVYTEDGMPSAQWEVTVAVTETGYEILAY